VERLKSYPIGGGVEFTMVGSLEPTLFLAYLRRFAAYPAVEDHFSGTECWSTLFLPRHISSTPEKCTRLLRADYCHVPRERESFWDLDCASLQLAIQVLRGGGGWAGEIIRDFKYGQRRWFFLVSFCFFSPLYIANRILHIYLDPRGFRNKAATTWVQVWTW
jgi:hypothetical protein